VISLRELKLEHPRWLWAAAGAVMAAGGLVWLFTGPATTELDSYNQCATAGYPITDTNPPACETGTQVFLGPVATPQALPAPATTQSFQVLVDGDSGGRYPQKNQLISNQTDWQTYWRTVHASLPSTPPLIPINFAASDVIALSSGPEATGGYMLEVTGISSSATGSVVSVSESVPTVTCNVPNAPSNRYYIVSTVKLPLPVVFQTTKTPRECPK